MHLLVVGLNHQSAPIEIREKIVFPVDRLDGALKDVVARDLVQEIVIVSTCNRTECYCVTESPDSRPIIDWLVAQHSLNIKDIHQHFYSLEGRQAVRQAFRVAAGLDSMVLGEPQILGQMKDAFGVAHQAETTGKLLNRLFQKSFAVAKQVRTDTNIGMRAISVASNAIVLAQQIYSSINEQTVMLIGAGETIELCAYHLYERSIGNMIIANRTFERAAPLAERYQGKPIPLKDIPDYLVDTDIVISSTASQLPILGKGAIERAMEARKHKPMLLIDLAVPRDIEVEANDLDGVYLYGIDDLRSIAEENIQMRREAAIEAESIIEAEVGEYEHWQSTLATVPTIRALREHAQELSERELTRAVRQIEQGESPASVLRRFSRTLINRLLHEPTVALRQKKSDQDNDLHKTTKELFKLKDKS